MFKLRHILILNGVIFGSKYHSIVFLFLFLISSISSSQTKNKYFDKNINFEELNLLFNKTSIDSIEKRNLIAKFYLNKAKSKQDSINMARGYYIYAMANNDAELGVRYSDSIIYVTKNIHHESFPAVGYFLRGYWNYNLNNYQTALSDYLKGDSIAHERGNLTQQFQNMKMIAALKNRAGDFDGALSIYLKELKFLQDIKVKNDREISAYLKNLYNTSLTYLHLENFELAKNFTELGITESLKVGDSSSYYNFVFNLGTTEYLLGNKVVAGKKITQSIDKIDNYSQAMAYYYLGNIDFEQNKFESSILKYSISDSISNSLNYYFPEMRKAYENLISFYESSDNVVKQLFFINKILKLDSTLLNNKELKIEISQKYDRPILIQKKEELISRLNLKNKNSNITIISLTIFASLLLIAFLVVKRKQRVNEKNYNNLINERKLQLKDVHFKKEVALRQELPEGVYDRLEFGLKVFEQEKGYLKVTTLNKLAKELDTNTAYLSKFINKSKGENFSHYLNELRIDYIIDRLEIDSHLRLYTIDAIANEAGYGTSQSFSKAFFKRTGIYPSYFIKKINKS